MRYRHVLLFLIAVLSVSHAYGFIREVPQQYPTIASALVTPNPNDTILLSAGIYREQIAVNIDVTIASRWIFSSDTSDIYNVVWIPDTGRLITVNRHRLQLIGIYFQADRTPEVDCGVIRGDSNFVLIDNCRIFGTYDSTWNSPISGTISVTRSNLIVRNSVMIGPDEGSCRAIKAFSSGSVYLIGSSFLGRRNSRDVAYIASHGSLYIDSCYFNHGGGGVSGGFIDGILDIRNTSFCHTSYYTLDLTGCFTNVVNCQFDSIDAYWPNFLMMGNVSQGDTLRFDRCSFQNYWTDPSGVLYYGGTPLVLSNCVFQNNNAGRLWETDRLFADSCIFGAANPPIVTGYRMNPLVHFQNCDFSTQSVISDPRWRYPPSLVTAPNCYWGSSTGPNHPQNPGGMGTFLPSYVNPFPFRTEPVFPENGVNDPGTVSYSLPNSIELLSPYPNPFNATVTIRFRLPHPGEASIAIYDVTGREVATLQRGYFSTVEQSIRWQPQAITSGTYFVRLQNGSKTATQAIQYSK